VLVLGRVAAVGLLAWLLWRSNGRPRLALWAMVLVLAGALGNLIDNLGLGCREEGHPFGLVRDFIDVWFRSEAWGWDWHFPTFNVADSCITVGAVLWVLSGFVHRAEPEPAPEPPDAEDAADPTERSALAPAGRPSAE
jgi:signal peptidase II